MKDKIHNLLFPDKAREIKELKQRNAALADVVFVDITNQKRKIFNLLLDAPQEVKNSFALVRNYLNFLSELDKEI